MALNKNGRYSTLTAIIPIAMIIIILLFAFLWLSGGYSVKTDDTLSRELSVTDIDKEKVVQNYSLGGHVIYQGGDDDDDDDDETCEDNSDCGTDGFIYNYFCSINDVWQNYRTFTCEGSGEDSFCSQNITPALVTVCNNTCIDGMCTLIVCKNDSDCDDSDIYTLDTCNNPGTDTSSCIHKNISCFSNSDCGTDGFIGNVFCNIDDVWQNYSTFTCESSGTTSYCSQTTTPTLVTTCSDICSNGVCISITCKNDSDCDDSNIYTLDTCNNPGTNSSYCTNENQQATLTLTLSDTIYELKNNIVINGLTYPKVHYYTHNRTFTESNNVGVTLTSGQLCFQSVANCNTASVNYRIDANDELIKYEQRFWTTETQDTFTLTYWGVDDNGYDIVISQQMCVSGASFTENC